MKSLSTLGLLILSLSSLAQTPTIISKHSIIGDCAAAACGNGLCVASCGRIFTSPDAKTWTSLNTDTVPAFGLLAFGNGLFVGVAGGIYTSADGISWTPRPADLPGPLSGLRFSHGAFYAVSGDANIIKSNDGINWTRFSMGIDDLLPVVFGGVDYNGSEYAVGMTKLSTRYEPFGSEGVLVSATGDSGSWTYNTLGVNAYVKNVIWVNGRFYLFAEASMATSTDGINWETTGASPPALVDTLLNGYVGAAGGDYAFAAGDSVYLVGTSTMQISAEGTHFKSYPAPNLYFPRGGLYVNGVTIIYGDGGLASAMDGVNFKLNGTNFTALATNGSGVAAAGRSFNSGQLFFSPDFATWTEQSPAGLPSINTMLYTGTKYVAAGNQNIYFSDDGANWSTNAVSQDFSAMGYGAGRFVGGSLYSLVSSTDGLAWSVADTNYNYYYKIRYLNNGFFAVGRSDRGNKTGRILQSADGIHWQDITPHLGFEVNYYTDAMYDGTKYYFTGHSEVPDLFTLSTTDPMNTASYSAIGTVVHPAPGTLADDYYPQYDDFFYHSGLFVGTSVNRIDGNTYLIYSSDGMSWTTTPLYGSGGARMAVSDGDVYRIVGDDGGFYTVTFAGSPLPVTLFDFTATAVASGVKENSFLNWRTGSESNSAYFMVQHSLDAVDWDSIGRVTAAGDSRVTANYQYTHAGPPVGINYYRLGITDRDGRRQWSAVRSVDISNKGELRLYPNPAREAIQVQLPGAGPANLVIYNSAGVPVRQQVVIGYSITLDLRSLTAGVYHLLVTQGEKRYIKEFIVSF